ncbi:DUF4249 domain-containing protein [Flavobacterium amnicola]|uniref:DUF4249 domain-containing protein n=1 Tax=Flavobacterium amnicola TaxID=2506422 RepID=A0A4Q1K6C8_9FLAO|nr:DUF4249 domain-containing protein [Flavobacterium amnicola]RXR19396.1 DUF4249 domain-containing protein [Flavobacterium amnicola]
MKKIVTHIVIATFLFFQYGCEDVVDIPLENTNPKLVIDANIKWQKGTIGDNQTIKLSLTNDFYSNEIAIASGAIVTVTDSDNTVFDFYQMSNSPNYVCDNFVPVVNKNYTLRVLYKGEIYTATNKLMATPTIDDIQQETVPGIDGEDSIQIKFFFQDNGSEDNFYLVGAKNPLLKVQEFGVISDEFFQGNRMFGFYTNEKLDRGSTLKFSLQGITNSYYNYMNKLIAMSSSNAGNPFATPTSTLRGNVLNTTNPENYPLGYFSLTEIDTREYLVQ